MSHIYLDYEDGNLITNVDCTISEIMLFTSLLLKDTELKLPESKRSEFRTDFLKTLNNCRKLTTYD